MSIFRKKMCILPLFFIALSYGSSLYADPTEDKKSSEGKEINPKEINKKDLEFLHEKLKIISETFSLVANITNKNEFYQMNCQIFTDKFCAKNVSKLINGLPNNLKFEVKEMDTASLLSKSKIKKKDSSTTVSPALVVKFFEQDNRIRCIATDFEENAIIIDEKYPLFKTYEQEDNFFKYLTPKLIILLNKMQTKEVNFLKKIRLINISNNFNLGKEVKAVDLDFIKELYDKLNEDPRLLVYTEGDSEKDANYNIFLFQIDNKIKLFSFSSNKEFNQSKEFFASEKNKIQEIQTFVGKIVGFEIKEKINLQNNALDYFNLGIFFQSSEMYEEAYNLFAKAYFYDIENKLPRKAVFKKLIGKLPAQNEIELSKDPLIKSKNVFPYVFDRNKMLEAEKNRLEFMSRDFENLTKNFDLLKEEYLIVPIPSFDYFLENQREELIALEKQFLKKYTRTFGIINTIKNEKLFTAIDNKHKLIFMEIAFLEACNDDFMPLENSEKEDAAKLIVYTYFNRSSNFLVETLIEFMKNKDPYLKKYANKIASEWYGNLIYEFETKASRELIKANKEKAERDRLDQIKNDFSKQLNEFYKNPSKEVNMLGFQNLKFSKIELESMRATIRSIIRTRQDGEIINNISNVYMPILGLYLDAKNDERNGFSEAEYIAEINEFNELFDIYNDKGMTGKIVMFFESYINQITWRVRNIKSIEGRKKAIDITFNFIKNKIFIKDKTLMSEWNDYMTDWVHVVTSLGMEKEEIEKIELIYKNYLSFINERNHFKADGQKIKNLINIIKKNGVNSNFIARKIYTWQELLQQNEEIGGGVILKEKWDIKNDVLYQYASKYIEHNKRQFIVTSFDLKAEKFLPTKHSDELSDERVRGRGISPVSLNNKLTCFESDKYFISVSNFKANGNQEFSNICKIPFYEKNEQVKFTNHEFSIGRIEKMALAKNNLFLIFKNEQNKIFASCDTDTFNTKVILERKNNADGMGWHNDLSELYTYQDEVYLNLFQGRNNDKQAIFYLNSYNGTFKSLFPIEEDRVPIIFNFDQIHKVYTDKLYTYYLDGKTPVELTKKYIGSIYLEKIPFKDQFFSHTSNIRSKNVMVQLKDTFDEYDEIENTTHDHLYGYSQVSNGLIIVTDLGVVLIYKN